MSSSCISPWPAITPCLCLSVNWNDPQARVAPQCELSVTGRKQPPVQSRNAFPCHSHVTCTLFSLPFSYERLSFPRRWSQRCGGGIDFDRNKVSTWCPFALSTTITRTHRRKMKLHHILITCWMEIWSFSMSIHLVWVGFFQFIHKMLFPYICFHHISTDSHYSLSNFLIFFFSGHNSFSHN